MGLLLAGLWPFDFWRPNNVHWIDGSPGLRFDRYGIVHGKEPFFSPGGTIDLSKPFTIRMDVRPTEEPSDSLPRILSVYDADGRELFFVGQWRSNLAVRILEGERFSRLRYRETAAAGLQSDVTRTIAIRSDVDSLTIFVDGSPARTAHGVSFFLLPDKREPAWISLGNSPNGKAPWHGELRSLSFFSGALSPWNIAVGPLPVVIYRFTEGTGTICRGSVDPRHGLVIPPVFRAPAKGILTPPWRIERCNLSFWKDVAVNILGFIPFGFFVFACLSKGEKKVVPSITVVVVMLGAGISLSIELLQVYLPTRDSSFMDFMNNILGTYIGVWLFRKEQ